MAITTADIAKLRQITAAGMMDCKAALTEANGDFEKAIEIIRKKGKLIANKRADREASEGVALSKVSSDGKHGALIVLNCETDFVAKNKDFIAVAEKILEVALQNNPSSLDELLKAKLDNITVNEKVEEQMAVIGEKIQLAYYDKIEAHSVVAYIHPGNKLATLVGFNKPNVDIQVMKDIAMQVAAMDPVAIDKNDVPQNVLDKELEIAKEQVRLEGKPENMVEKIAAGKLNKFFNEKTLLNQEFIKDNKLTVRKYLENFDKELKVTEFKRYNLNI
jgi:elongation factor Ts